MRVILHNVRSIHNVASIFRTANGLGTERIYLTGVTPAPLDRFGAVREQFAKVALGAERDVSWQSAADIGSVLKALRADGFRILAVEQARASAPYFSARLPKGELGKTALILGNEVRGLSSSVLRAADRILEIPMLGGKESLNVAIAFAVVGYHLCFVSGPANRGRKYY